MFLQLSFISNRRHVLHAVTKFLDNLSRPPKLPFIFMVMDILPE